MWLGQSWQSRRMHCGVAQGTLQQVSARANQQFLDILGHVLLCALTSAKAHISLGGVMQHSSKPITRQLPGRTDRNSTNHKTNITMTTNAPQSLPSHHADVIAKLGWHHTSTLVFEPRAAAFAESKDLPSLTPSATALVATGGPLFKHQALAVEHHCKGKNVVISTGTGSGKSRVFHLAAANVLGTAPRALVLAVYPSKPLAREQAEKWRAALMAAGLSKNAASDVALITGDQGVKDRANALAAARVAILTPDVLHAWLLANLENRQIRQALARLQLVVIDEAHTFAGVFGSNTLLLLRRLRFAHQVVGGTSLRWIAASGTLASPGSHLEALVGCPFEVVNEDEDTSPRHRRFLHVVRPDGGVPFSSGLQYWLQNATERNVVFCQSRKQTELLSLMANRQNEESTGTVSEFEFGRFAAPYRAGLDATERADLQDRFAKGELRTLVCTSAFELGIDLPGLNLGFLVGLPESPASFWQRIGRFGRHGDAHVYVLDDGSAHNRAYFDDPGMIRTWKARDAAIYPENAILLARNALCLAHEATALKAGASTVSACSALPDALKQLYAALHRGEPTVELRDAMADQGNTQPPHLAFPIRASEEVYKFKPAAGTAHAPLGFLSYCQLLREGYPGAVYYHNCTAWRVTRLNRREKTISVVRERAYHTKPRTIPPMLVPDLSRPVFKDLSWPDCELRVIEAQARATEAVTGVSEVQGNRRLEHDYNQGSHGQTGPLFRSYETTAVFIFHPTFEQVTLGSLKVLGTVMREALLLSCPRETSEVVAATGTLKAARRNLREDRHFLAIYDTIPGSLRLSAALGDPAVLREAIGRLRGLAQERFAGDDSIDSAAVLKLISALVEAVHTCPQSLPSDWPSEAITKFRLEGEVVLHRKMLRMVRIVRSTQDFDGNLRYEIVAVDNPSLKGEVSPDALVDLPALPTEVLPLSA